MICKLSDQGLIQVQGMDARKFLQGQLTCNVEKSISMGAHCNPQGRVLSLFYFFEFQQAYYLLMPRSMISLAIAALKKYAIFFKVTLEDLSAEWRILGIQDKSIHPSQESILIPVKNSRYMIAGKNETLKTLQANATENEWKSCMIHDGIPSIYPETSGKFLPHELNLHLLNAIDFDKGCYTGQEIIARMHYRGKLKNHLLLASVSSDFSPVVGTDIYRENNSAWEAAGKVVDFSPEVYNHQYDMLIVANENDININPSFLMQNKKAVEDR